MDAGKCKNMTNQLDLTDIHRKPHPTTAEYTFFFKADRIFTKIDNMLDNRPSLNEFPRTMITEKLNYKPTTERKLRNSQMFENLKKQISK